MEPHAIADVFLNNRAELLPADVSPFFIVPPFFNRISIFADKKSVRIVGGRGCGKTMFIRYFCYPTQLSRERGTIYPKDLEGVGLYWRPDTGFSAMMKASWLGDQEATLAFQHYASLVLLEEFCSFLDTLADCPLEGGACDVRGLPLPASMKPYFPDSVNTLQDISSFAQTGRASLEMWVQNPGRTPPDFLSYETMLQRLADYVAGADPRLKHLFLRIFVDEFENLQPHQRRLVCDGVKHPKARFSINFAMRRDAIGEFLTSGNEQIAEPHDYRTIDIEKEFTNQPDEFSLVAGEMLLLHLVKDGISLDGVNFDPNRLSRREALKQRVGDAYRSGVLKKARSIFPELSTRDISRIVFEDDSLKRRLAETIKTGLDQSGGGKKYTVDDFMQADVPEASIVSAFVLNRKRPGPDDVLRELHRAKAKEAGNLFDRVGGWIDNNLHGALFYLYIGLPTRPNLLYSGFDRFCQLSRPNLRYFQELCHGALLQEFERRSANDMKQGDIVVTPANQVIAAVGVSEALVRNVAKLGIHGYKLQEITKRLGKLFETAHRRRSQSEPEINHFSIDDSDRMELSPETSELLREARIWSVLYEYPDTKNKSSLSLPQTDLVPNPIFSPHFRISYRKRRKITLKSAQINAIFSGTGAQFEAVLRDLSKQWDIDDRESPVTGTLF